MKNDNDFSTKDKILKAAKTVFFQKGYDGTRTRDIATEANVNLAMLNYHFKSKEQLFELVMKDALINFISVIREVLNDPNNDFDPKLAFTQKDPSDRPSEAIDDLIPNKIYSKLEIVEYLKKSRQKCKDLIETLTDERLNERFTEGNEENDMDYPILEILLYNLRHTQHHVAQLNMLIRQDLGQHMDWSFRAGDIQNLGFNEGR